MPQCETCTHWYRDKRTEWLGNCVLKNYITKQTESCKQHQKKELIILIEKELQK